MKRCSSNEELHCLSRLVLKGTYSATLTSRIVSEASHCICSNFVYIACVFLSAGGKRRGFRHAALFVLTFALSGCSVQHLAIQSLTEVFENGFQALNEESDLLLAEQAIASNLKTIEGVVRSDPDNVRLLFLLSRGYSGYALGFIEDVAPARAREMYRRGKEYGLRILRRNDAFAAAIDGSLADFEGMLQTLDDENVQTVFWTAMGWAGYINLSKDDPDALAQMPWVLAMMRFVLEREEQHYYGGAHLFFGTWFAAQPGVLGGDPDSSRYHFLRCIEVGEGKFLLPYVYYARYYAVQVQDSKLFEELLEKVLTTSSDVLPEQRLINSISKRKAEKYLNEIETYF